ncbi:DUF4190 domain-containing protein [Lacihabitans sp. LS3-19]|uniref:DUF4190 domain-containing protein n=1 Tax=Lacihabitans sp. LS3-19 TaxID=2487335 RepID=UPI0020CD81D9|nr:DUF4190 domain-containing protein [Lacihabitans sp. LS3-19]MCP9766348.1 DUF4190 domain-containing protein [Lacihabitans sp. LS3-19]
MNLKSAFLFIFLCGFWNTSFASDTRIDNYSKLDSILAVQSNLVSKKDSTIAIKKPYEISSIIGFSSSLASILSWGIQLLGISSLSLIFSPLLFGLVGLIFSIIAIGKIKKNGKRGKKLAKAGIILTILHALGLAALVALVIIIFSNFGG